MFPPRDDTWLSWVSCFALATGFRGSLFLSSLISGNRCGCKSTEASRWGHRCLSTVCRPRSCGRHCLTVQESAVSSEVEPRSGCRVGLKQRGGWAFSNAVSPVSDEFIKKSPSTPELICEISLLMCSARPLKMVADETRPPTSMRGRSATVPKTALHWHQMNRTPAGRAV